MRSSADCAGTETRSSGPANCTAVTFSRRVTTSGSDGTGSPPAAIDRGSGRLARDAGRGAGVQRRNRGRPTTAGDRPVQRGRMAQPDSMPGASWPACDRPARVPLLRGGAQTRARCRSQRRYSDDVSQDSRRRRCRRRYGATRTGGDLSARRPDGGVVDAAAKLAGGGRRRDAPHDHSRRGRYRKDAACGGAGRPVRDEGRSCRRRQVLCGGRRAGILADCGVAPKPIAGVVTRRRSTACGSPRLRDCIRGSFASSRSRVARSAPGELAAAAIVRGDPSRLRSRRTASAGGRRSSVV